MTTARERSKELFRVELAEAVYDYFASHGFESTSVDDVSQGVGVSRATFFRYFGSKEQAVITAVHAAPVDFAAALRALPVGGAGTGALWMRLRGMFDSAIIEADRRPAARRARVRMINETPSLKSRLAEMRAPQIASVADVLIADGLEPLVARALVSTAFALFEAAWGEWATVDDTSIADILDRVFAMVGPTSSEVVETESTRPRRGRREKTPR